MPVIINNQNATELQQKPVTGEYDALIPYLIKFVKSTSYMLSHYLLTDCVIGTSVNDNIEVRYAGEDENGKKWILSIELMEDHLKLTNTKLCNGIEIKNGIFRYLPITKEEAYSQFYSATSLLLTDLGAWCSEKGISVEFIHFEPREHSYAFTKIVHSDNGESQLHFEHTGDYEF